MKTSEIQELKEILISHAMNDEEGRLVICEWSEIEEYGFPDFNPELDADSLIGSLYRDERVCHLWEREIENEPVLTFYYWKWGSEK